MTIRDGHYRWLGAMAMVMFVIVALPARLGRPEHGHETQAIASLKQISSAEVAYSASCGNGGYAVSLDVLLAPVGPGGEPLLAAEAVKRTSSSTVSHVFLLGPGLGSGSGPTDCLGRPTRTGYYAAAVPGVFDRASSRAFAMSTDGVIWQMTGSTAPAEPFSAPATRLQ